MYSKSSIGSVSVFPIELQLVEPWLWNKIIYSVIFKYSFVFPSYFMYYPIL